MAISCNQACLTAATKYHLLLILISRHFVFEQILVICLFVINFLLTATFSVTTDYFCESMIIIFPFKLFMLASIYYIQFCNVICKNLKTSSWTHSVYIGFFILDNQDVFIFKKELSLLKSASWHGILFIVLLHFWYKQLQ